MEQKKQWTLAKERLKTLVAERKDHQYTQRRTIEQVTLAKDTPKAHTQSDLFVTTLEEEPVIRKVALEPSSLTSFDEDLEEEINTTNLKYCVSKAYHTYLNIFSEWQSQQLLEYTFWDHAIELKPTFKPQAPKIYALSSEKHDELGKFIKEHLSKGTI